MSLSLVKYSLNSKIAACVVYLRLRETGYNSFQILQALIDSFELAFSDKIPWSTYVFLARILTSLFRTAVVVLVTDADLGVSMYFCLFRSSRLQKKSCGGHLP